MQWRLSAPVAGQPQAFPLETWRREFDDAKSLGFDCIEWLLADGDLDANPLWTPAGIGQLRDAVDETHVHVLTVCGDYFLRNPITEGDPGVSTVLLRRTIAQTAAAGASVLLVPCLEDSSIAQQAQREQAAEILAACGDAAAEEGVSLGVETDLPADQIIQWLSGIGHPAVGVYYDLGNAVAMGYDPLREIPQLSAWMKGLHIKDRTYQGGNVPLGTGSVPFAQCLHALRDQGYTGPLVLETIRGDDFRQDAERHLMYIHELLNMPHPEG